MNFYKKNIEFLARKSKLDQNSLAMEIGIDLTDLIRPTPDDLIKISNHFSITLDLLLKANLSHHTELSSFMPKLLVMDVDGVLTDGGMYYTENGDEFKKFNAKDGMAIKAIKKAGVKTGIISNGTNQQIVAKRASILNIDLVEVSHLNKLEVLSAWCTQLGIELKEVAYIGDDINDLEIISKVGFSACPADAVAVVKANVTLILASKGGEGCVREWIDTYFLNK